MARLDRLLVAGPRSGAGKTTITLGLLAALAERGRKVQPFKVGPDFIDTGFHAALTKRPCYNLDGWMMPGERLADTFRRAMRRGADLAVVEGMMGLYDGAGAGESGASSADIAKRLGLPVILVLDVFAMAGSAGAAALGYRLYDPEVNVAGVILNRLAGDRHAAACNESLARAGFRVLGAVPAEESLALPERHLGLVPAWEQAGAGKALRAMAGAVASHLDIDAILAIAAAAPALADAPAGTARTNGRSKPEPVAIGIARDEAFGFYYQDTLDALAAAGAVLVPFAPTRDEELPPDLGGLYLGGGFPERHLDALEANVALRSEIAGLARAGMPIYAECGGLMYLCRSIAPERGVRRAMAGALDGHVRMGGRQSIAYVEVDVRADTPLAPAGTQLRGHVFHNSVVERIGEGARFAYRLTPGPGIAGLDDGWLEGNVLASYTHLPLAAYPELVTRWLMQCRHFRDRHAAAGGE
jgi:cobyrinic acid a,c-diamide synthase